MDYITRDAVNIVKGMQQGDEYVWEAEYVDEDGNARIGAWQSYLDKHPGIRRDIDEDEHGEPE